METPLRPNYILYGYMDPSASSRILGGGVIMVYLQRDHGGRLLVITPTPRLLGLREFREFGGV